MCNFSQVPSSMLAKKSSKFIIFVDFVAESELPQVSSSLFMFPPQIDLICQILCRISPNSLHARSWWQKIFMATSGNSDTSFVVSSFSFSFLTLIAMHWTVRAIAQPSKYRPWCRSAKAASSNYRLECLCKCKETRCWWFCPFYLVCSYIRHSKQSLVLFLSHSHPIVSF